MSQVRVAIKKIRILIADREGVFRFGLKKLFGLEDDLRVVAQGENSTQVFTLAKAFRPDVLFVQVEIAAEEAGDLLPRLRRLLPRSKVLITASSLARDEALRYMKAGASGIILKSVTPGLFVKSARKVMENELWLSKPYITHMAKALEYSRQSPLRPADTLTRREKNVISGVMLGWRNLEIAHHLAITEQTVKNHLRAIYDKLGVSDRLELVLYAIHQRLDLPPVRPRTRI